MKHEGPLLEALTHRLSECPADFLAKPVGLPGGVTDVAAVVCDHLRAMGLHDAHIRRAAALYFRSDKPAEENRIRLASIATWMLHDPWFLARAEYAKPMWELLSGKLGPLAAVIKAEAAVGDPDRREELARFCLKALDLRPAGESAAQSADRLNSLDSAERLRVVKESRAAEERARQVREAMAKKAAEEAASRYSPE